jgi:copper homeostasis protein
VSAPILEIAANSVASALAAEAGGAARVELCCALELGGLTPSRATIAMARERLGIPIHVLIRPRPGDFAYDDLECESMLRDIEHCRTLGCEGVVLGALDADGNVDVARCRGLIAAAKGMNTTFHRAFDGTCDPESALEDVIALGCGRLLTSGQAANALSGAPLIRKLAEQSRERIVVMAGAGITPENIIAVAAASGVRELHASAKRLRPSSMHRSNTSLPGLADSTWCTDADQVRAMAEALRAVAD